MPDSLYIHIPFCVRKCIYCDFFSVVYDEATARAYVDALCRELDLKRDSAHTLRTVYIGGGTPSLLPDQCVRQIFQSLHRNFILSPSPEITVEANPGTISESGIATMRAVGVNRCSVGVQSLNDAELRTLGRTHDHLDSLRSVELIKKSGFTNVSIDVMYAIPGQRMDSWRDTVASALALSPSHIAAYELTPEKNTRLHTLLQAGREKNSLTSLRTGRKGNVSGQPAMPEEDVIVEMYDHVIDRLTEAGYVHYEISNFALPAFRSLHNLNYWDRGEYLCAGVGAHSFVNGIRARNIPDIRQYIAALNRGIIPEIESLRIAPADALKEYIFLGLRKTEGINMAKAEDLMAGLPESSLLTPLKRTLADAGRELVDEGYLEADRGNLRLTRRGIVLSSTIIVALFDRLGL